jgi:Protein of unknown function (DUF4242)
MQRYLIERDIPNVGRLGAAQLRDLAAKSNRATAELAGKVQWLQSFLAGDKTFCVYLAESETAIREHARIAGFPITTITEIPTAVDPMTGIPPVIAIRAA